MEPSYSTDCRHDLEHRTQLSSEGQAKDFDEI